MVVKMTVVFASSLVITSLRIGHVLNHMAPPANALWAGKYKPDGNLSAPPARFFEGPKH